MSSHPGIGRRDPHRQSLLKKAFLTPFGIIYRAWTFTIRLRYPDQEDRAKIENYEGPLVIILWHNRLFLAGEWHLRFRKRKSCYGLISGSRDGAWLETFYGWAGIHAVRGSRNRRGHRRFGIWLRLFAKGTMWGLHQMGREVLVIKQNLVLWLWQK